jgi:uncharacterized membrane protein YgcG
MNYPDIVILAFNNALSNDQEAYRYLAKSNHPELAALADFMCCENTTALNFILRNRIKYHLVVDFLAALGKNERAFKSLFKKDKRLAAVVAYSRHSDEQAYDWLERNNFQVYADLSLTLYEVLRNNSGSFGSISGGGGFSSGGGGGFGGFGGGGFSGGGSGGSW